MIGGGWLLMCASAAIADEAGRRVCNFEHDGLRIEVAEEAAGPGYDAALDLTVRNDELLLTRLSADEPRPIQQCWLADLNGNGSFEVVIALGPADAETPAGVRLFEWEAGQLSPLRVAPLGEDVRAAGTHSERYIVAGRDLIAAVTPQARATGDGAAHAPAIRYRYSFAGAAWELLPDE